MPDVVVIEGDSAPVKVVRILEPTGASIIVENSSGGGSGTPGPAGPPGADGNPNIFIQLTEPTPDVGLGAYIWFVLDADGHVTDIRKGVA